MRILSINSIDKKGGAARAAHRLHHGLIENGINSQMLVQKKTCDETSIIGPSSGKEKFLSLFRPDLDTAVRKMIHRKPIKSEFSINSFPFTSFLSSINKIAPDLVHLHWINGGMIRIEQLAKMEHPIIWTLHDMWAFTGGCHYSSGCKKYKTHCNSCSQITSNKYKDISYKTFERKFKSWGELDLTIVTPSKWLGKCATESVLLKHFPIKTISNGLNLQSFRPIDSSVSRQTWNLPNKDTKLILFGAMSATSDKRKGFDLLHESIEYLYDNISDKVEVLIYGASEPLTPPDFKFPVRYLGTINDDISLALLYSAVDLMVVPSREDNLPNTVMESIACGTPVVAFDIGGMPDMIDHKKNGYLATAFDCEDLANGLQYIMSSDASEIRKNARKKAEETFDIRQTAQEYTKLYKKILS